MNILKRHILHRVVLAAFFCLAFLPLACKKSNQTDPIPAVPVNITIPLRLPEFSALNSIGNYVYVSGGYRGIIVYRRTLDQFVAFERACPFDPTASGSIITVDSSGVMGKDGKCGSKFSLFDGSVVNGPAARPLKPYNVEYNQNSETLYIYN